MIGAGQFSGQSRLRPEMDDGEYVDYGDDYDDEYGSQTQEYMYQQAAAAGLLDGSGNSQDFYDDEDITDSSQMLKQQAFLQHQMAQQAAKKQLAQKAALAGQFGGASKSPPGYKQGAGGAGAKSNLFNVAGPGAGAKAGAGGFAYGAASGAGGSLFGAASAAGGNTFAAGLGALGAMGGAGSAGGLQFGAMPKAESAGGGFAFGAASKFGGLGAGGGAGGYLGSAAPDAAADDPYNIPIDLTKVKNPQKPQKTFEEKTTEEKMEAMQQMSKNIKATGAKSIMKKPGQSPPKGKKSAKVSFGQCLIYEYDKAPESNDPAKRVDSKDISDMRDEKTKLRDLLQEKENEQLAQFKRLQALKSKTEEKSSALDKFKSSQSEPGKVDDSIGESASLSQSKGRDKQTESYDTDTFEDHSASKSDSRSLSGSAHKPGIVQWPGKEAMGHDSLSASQSKEQAPQVYAAGAMEEYMRKQQAKGDSGAAGSAATSAKPAMAKSPQKDQKKTTAASKDFSESSDRYTDEDFESMSKSQGALAALPKAQPKRIHTKIEYDVDPQTEVGPSQSRMMSKYVKKENRYAQTNIGERHEFMGEEEGGHTGVARAWTLKRQVEDAELIIQQHKDQHADLREEMLALERRLKQTEADYRSVKREALNANETNSRMKEQLQEYRHKINLYSIETEELIKQIDLADAKTREKEDELRLMEAEYDRKMKLQEERILFRRAKNEEREINELKRTHALDLDELKGKMTEREEEIHYYKSKVDKIEVENRQLRLGKGDNKKMKELENEVEFLKAQLQDAQRSGGGASGLSAAGPRNMGARNVKQELSPEEQVQLQKEIQQLDRMLSVYENENQKLMGTQKGLEQQLKDLNAKLAHEENQVKTYKLKALKEKSGVYVEEDDDEVNIMAKNVMGSAQAISQKELDELYQKVKELQTHNDNSRRDLSLQANQFKAQISKLRDDKAQAEKQLFDTEFLVGEKDRELEKLRDEANKQFRSVEQENSELQEKLTWFRENQKLLTEGEDEQKSTFQELNELKQQLQKAKEDKKRLQQLEKKCKLLEDTAKSKNPNSIAMLIQAAKTDAVNDNEAESKRELSEKVRQLNYELESQDQEYERKLRAMRQESERVKAQYDQRAGQTPEAKRIAELEKELQQTKNHYVKRIREIEDKYKYGKGASRANSKSALAEPPKSTRSQQSERKLSEAQNDLNQLRADNDRLTKERNHLANKVFELEQNNNLQRNVSGASVRPGTPGRRGSFSGLAGSQSGTPRGPGGGLPDPNASPNQDLSNLFYSRQENEENTSASKPPRGGPSGTAQAASPGRQNANLNPFSVGGSKAQAQKSIPELLDIFGKINFAASFRKQQMKVGPLHALLTSELGVAITPTDLKNLNRFLLSRQAEDQDEDLEFMDKDEDVLDLQFLQSQLQQQSSSPGQQKLIDQLKAENRRLRAREAQLNDDNEFTLNKTDKLKRELFDGESEKRQLQDKVNKLEAQKRKLEDVFKQTMKGGNMDLIDEVQMMARKIEFLEEQSEKRAKAQYLENQEPYIREIEMLKSKLAQEREIRDQMIQKKNAEVAYFKAELDALLSEMSNQFKKKQSARVK